MATRGWFRGRVAYHVDMSNTFMIDFDKPIAVFPWHSVILYPQTVHPLHIFELRYRQLVEDSIERSPTGEAQHGAPIALAVTERGLILEDACSPQALRPVVCIGRILQDETLPDGRHNILVHGICRAQIRELHEPDEQRRYRTASMRPIESGHAESPSPMVRAGLKRLLGGGRLSRMTAADAIRDWIEREDVPIETLIEMASFILVKDEAVRYQLLAEPDPSERARIIHSELEHIDRLVSLCDRQKWRDWPTNLSWN
jgi:Lon protease-like protein